jgi:uncharacterized surface protein with fasciclin (FAS1) repeats
MKRINIIQLSIFLSGLLLAGSCAEEFKEVAPPAGSTIVQIASGSADFNILTAALVKTGLDKTFNNNNSGAFTVFAPTDAAFVAYFNSLGGPFAALDEVGVLNWINTTLSPTVTPGPNLAALTGVLLYHVVSSEIPSSKVTGAQGFVTLSSYLSGTVTIQTRLSVSKVGSNVVLNANRIGQNVAGNGGQSVTLDIDASNGIIHSIDKVLIPVSINNIWVSNLLNFSVNYRVSPPAVTVFGTVLRRVPPVAPSTTPGTINLTDGAAPAPVDAFLTNYNLLSMAIAKAELATAIIPNATPFPDFTVFAPNDAAFLTFLGVANEVAARDALNALTPAALATIIGYHVVRGRVLSTDLSDGQVITTLSSGNTFSIGINGSTVTLVDKGPAVDATVTVPNILTNAGIVHQISGVLRLQ